MTFMEDMRAIGKLIQETRMPFRRGRYGNVAVTPNYGILHKGKFYKGPTDRLEIYAKAYEYYLEHQYARPVANLTAAAIFGKGILFKGDNDQVAFARKVFNTIDLFQVGLESGLYGDVFIRTFVLGDNGEERKARLVILPPDTVDRIPVPGNVLDTKNYVQFANQVNVETIDPNEVVHVMVNAVSNSLYGNSDFRHLFYWFDMYDSLAEGADKRRLFFSYPIGKLTGVDLRHKATIQAMFKDRTRDIDAKLGQRSSVPAGSQLLLSKNMDYEFVEPRGRFPLEDMIMRVAKTIATASETPLHWLNLSEEINRATAKEMSFPFLKKIQRRQDLFSKKFEELLLNLKDKMGDDWPGYDFDLTVGFPPVLDYSLEEISTMIKGILAIDQSGRLSGISILDLICNYLGLDVEAEQERLDQEEGEREEPTEIERIAAKIGKAVANGEIEPEVATKMLIKTVKD